MEQRLVFTGKQEVSLERFTPPAVKPHEIGVRTLCTLMSIGTENIIFNRLFEPGTNFDSWVRYPFYPGYACVGEIDQIGSEVTWYEKGDIVVMRAPHASYHVVSGTWALKVPAGLEARQAAWFAFAKITFMGARAAEHHLGDTVCLIGAGPIGQMSLRWANAAGAQRVIVIDRFPRRLEMAKLGGATHVISKPVEDCLDDVLAANEGNPPRLVIDSTGNERVFPHALKLARWRGRVLLIGDTGTPSCQHLTQDIICKGLTVVGAHDSHMEGEWTEHRAYQIFFQLALTGRFNLDGLITDVFTPGECAEAYNVVNTRRGETMGVLFDWTGGAPLKGSHRIGDAAKEEEVLNN